MPFFRLNFKSQVLEDFGEFLFAFFFGLKEGAHFRLEFAHLFVKVHGLIAVLEFDVLARHEQFFASISLRVAVAQYSASSLIFCVCHLW